MTNSNGEQNVLLPRYMTQFRCIGGACEEHCCQQWQINIDRTNYKRMQKALSRSAEDREKFDKVFKRKRSSLDKENAFACLVLREDNGSCPFVEESGLCEIHRRFGESHLSFTCRSYPRKVNEWGGGVEVSGAISCPEVARLCLLDAKANTLEQRPLSDLPVKVEFQVARARGSVDPYVRYVHEIREIVCQLLQAAQYSVSFRLFLVGYFSNRISEFFFKKSQEFREDLLVAEVERLGDSRFLGELKDYYEGLEASIGLPMNIVQTLLMSRPGKRSFNDLVVKVWSEYDVYDEKQQKHSLDLQDDNTVDCRDMLPLYQQRREQIRLRFSTRIDQYFERYCRNYWFAESYVDSPDLLVHTQNLLVRLAIISFLFYSHPGLHSVLSLAEAPTVDEGGLVDRIAVEVFYKFSRAIEHDSGFLKRIDKALAEQEMKSFAHAVQLAKFI